MKSEILNKLENLLQTENVLSVQKEFKQLSAQFRSLAAHGISDIDESEDDHEDDETEDEQNTSDKAEKIKPDSESSHKEEEIQTIDEKAQQAESADGNTMADGVSDTAEPLVVVVDDAGENLAENSHQGESEVLNSEGTGTKETEPVAQDDEVSKITDSDLPLNYSKGLDEKAQVEEGAKNNSEDTIIAAVSE